MVYEENTATCIGVIIDGNRRWARKNNISILRGHHAGYEKFKQFVGWCKDAGIRHIIAYVFSTENWKRAPEEVSYLMQLLEYVLRRDLEELKQDHVRIRAIGDLARLPPQLRALMQNAEDQTNSEEELQLCLALSYGGRNEIVDAVNRILQERGRESAKLTTQDFAQYLWTKDIPDPDLIIRTSGEMRLSNFLPWQSTYSELFFLPMLWPDITKEDLLAVLQEYNARQRRFGA